MMEVSVLDLRFKQGAYENDYKLRFWEIGAVWGTGSPRGIRGCNVRWCIRVKGCNSREGVKEGQPRNGVKGNTFDV